jgi:outer membrane lipopolysaccharide assembly protein LptE/RlpB
MNIKKLQLRALNPLKRHIDISKRQLFMEKRLYAVTQIMWLKSITEGPVYNLFNKYRKMSFLRIGTAWIIFLFLMIVSACGYRFTGGGSFPAGIKSICVVTFENRTSETGAENIFTNDLIYEITRDNKVILTRKDKADALLSGIIKSMSIQTISRAGTHSSLERRVTVTVDIKLTTLDGKVLWSANDVKANEAYDVRSDKLATEQQRRGAISALSKRLAQSLYARITDDF